MDMMERFALQFPEITSSPDEMLAGALDFAAGELSGAERTQLVRELRWAGFMTESARAIRLRSVGWSYLPEDPAEEGAFFADLAELIAALDKGVAVAADITQ